MIVVLVQRVLTTQIDQISVEQAEVLVWAHLFGCDDFQIVQRGAEIID